MQGRDTRGWAGSLAQSFSGRTTERAEGRLSCISTGDHFRKNMLVPIPTYLEARRRQHIQIQWVAELRGSQVFMTTSYLHENDRRAGCHAYGRGSLVLYTPICHRRRGSSSNAATGRIVQRVSISRKSSTKASMGTLSALPFRQRQAEWTEKDLRGALSD